MSNKASKDKSEAVRLIKFDSNNANWHEWSVKTTALAKTKGLRNAYYKDTKPCSSEDYKNVTNGKKVQSQQQGIPASHHELHRDYFWSCQPGKDGRALQRQCIQGLDKPNKQVHPKRNIRPDSNFNKCGMKNSRSNPDEWFIQLDLLCHRMTAFVPLQRRTKS